VISYTLRYYRDFIDASDVIVISHTPFPYRDFVYALAAIVISFTQAALS